MREFEDIHKLIDEQTQNPYEREALRDLTAMLAGGALEAVPRESFQDELRQRLLTEAKRAKRVPWFRAPLALGAAAAVVMAVVAGAALRGSGFGAAGRQMNAASSAPSQSQIAATVPAGGATTGDADAAAIKTLTSVEVASVPQNAMADQGQWRAASDGTSTATAVSRGFTRPDVRDSAMVKVEPGAATFTVSVAALQVPQQLSRWTLASAVVTPSQVTAEAQLAGVAGNLQTGFDHYWVGAPEPGQQQPAPNLPPYKQPGHWLVAGHDWGNGWSYYLINDNPAPATPVANAEDAARTAREFLQHMGVAQAENLAVAAFPDPKQGGYSVDWQLRLGGIGVNGVQGILKIGADGGIRYASWPAVATLTAGSASQVLQPDEAIAALRATPFDWYDAAPKLTVTQMELAYRWPPAAVAGAVADLQLVYNFTVRDTEGHEAVLTVPAWRP